MGGHTTNIAIERQPSAVRSRFGGRETDAQNSIRTQAALVLRTIERDHCRVDFTLILCFQSGDGFSDFAVDGLNSLKHALAKIFALVPITLFNRFISAGRRARRHRRAAEAAIFQHDIDLYGRIAAALENLASVNIEDHSHGGAPVANVGMICSAPYPARAALAILPNNLITRKTAKG